MICFSADGEKDVMIEDYVYEKAADSILDKKVEYKK